MGFDFVSQVDPDFATSEQYFADYARQRKLWLAERGGFDAVEDDEGVVTLVEREKVEKGRQTTVLVPAHRIEITSLGTSPKGLAKALTAMGWTVNVWLTVGDVAPVFFLNDSKEGDKNEHSAGDVRHEGFIARRYTVEGRFGEHPVAIQAFYLGKGQEGNSASFEWCRIRDSAYGIDVPNGLDYTYTKPDAEAKGWTEEMRIQYGMRMNRQYNDKPIRREHRVYYWKADPMNQWVDFYLDATKTENDGKRLTRKKKEPEKPATDAQLLSGEEWTG
ncbi:MAG: hypothetical protein K0S70_105 [Microbacterium sp.]|jgi:hypothetical protein|nr:hypothetical protein [Microbacterium sp.]